MELTLQKKKPCKCCLIKNFISHDIREGVKKLKHFISKEEVLYVAKHQYNIPDSKNCLDALQLVKECSPTHLLNHSLRSYAFGVSMAHKVDKKFDKEVFFLGSIMHDLGLTQKYDSNETFEISGAKIAKEFCINHGIELSKADMVHEMVALHDSVGVAHKCEPEIALLHFGAGADVAGLWIDDIHKKTLEEILEEYPRLDFKEGMIKLIADQVKRKPHSYIGSMVDLGFLKKIKNAPFES